MLNKKDAISKAESNVFLIFNWLYFILFYFIYFVYISYVILMLNDPCSKLNTCVKGPCLVSSKMQLHHIFSKNNPNNFSWKFNSVRKDLFEWMFSFPRTICLNFAFTHERSKL